MSRKEGNGGVNLGDRALFSEKEIGVVSHDSPDIGECLIIRLDHVQEVVER